MPEVSSVNSPALGEDAMSKDLRQLLVLGLLLVLVENLSAAEPELKDAFGDLLPPGALVRFGAARFRHHASVLAFAPDGKTLASLGARGDIRLYAFPSGRELARFEETGSIPTACLFHPDGKRVLVGDQSGKITVRDLTGRLPLFALTMSGAQISSLVLSTDGKSVYAAYTGGVVLQWDLTSGKEMRRITGPRKGVVRTIIAPDGQHFLDRLSGGKELALCDTATGTEIYRFDAVIAAQLVFTPDSKTVVVAKTAAPLTAWDVETGEQLWTFDRVTHSAPCVSPDGQFVAASDTSAILIRSTTTGELLRPLDLGGPTGARLAFAPDSKTLVVGRQSGWIQCWDIATGKPLAEVVGHVGTTGRAVFSPDGKQLLTTDDYLEYSACLWDATTGKLSAKWVSPGRTSLLPGPDGRSVFITIPKGVARVMVGVDAPPRVVLTGQERFANLLAVSPDGKRLVVQHGEGLRCSLKVWDLDTGKELTQLPGKGSWLTLASFSADGRALAVSGDGEALQVWDTATWKAWPAPNSSSTTRAVVPVFSADGKNVVVFSVEAGLWEVATGRPRWSRRDRLFARLVFSPDGSVLFTNGDKGVVRVLEAATGKELGQLGESAGHPVAVTPDGARLLTLSEGGATIWDVRAWTRRPRPVVELAADDLPGLWKDLGDADAAKAYKAVCTLTGSPRQSVALLKERMAGKIDPQHIVRLIRELDDDDFETREVAQKLLERLEEHAVLALRHTLESTKSPEVRHRTRELLGRHKEIDFWQIEVREVRAVEILEHVATAEARTVLGQLAKGESALRVTREAQAALARFALMKRDVTADDREK